MTSQKYTIYWKILLLLWFIICCKHINSSSLILSHIHSYTVWDNSQSHQKKNYTFKCPLVRRLWFQSWFERKTISNLLKTFIILKLLETGESYFRIMASMKRSLFLGMIFCEQYECSYGLMFFLNDLCVLERSRKRMKIIEITL